MHINSSSLPAIAKAHKVPQYDRVALKSGILHISLGAFHRAHEAVYLDDYLNLRSENWMIVGVGLMPQDA
ncbi:MAG: mannitol dehydrogenase family protein, partial [Herminiimonas sp.]|nr:mannitol dehydrogenase family protein [Herminiimonas sp.]